MTVVPKSRQTPVHPRGRLHLTNRAGFCEFILRKNTKRNMRLKSWPHAIPPSDPVSQEPASAIAVTLGRLKPQVGVEYQNYEEKLSGATLRPPVQS